jgi:hypothetical protein
VLSKLVALMMRAILKIVCFTVFAASAFAQERDILDFAAKNPRASQVQNPDGTYRTPKYGDYELERAVEQLKNYSQPFTVPKVIRWYRQAKDEKIRASLLRVLAASRDPRAALMLRKSMNEGSLDLRWAATYGLMDYFILFIVDGGTEQQIILVQEWWEKNRERLEKEAKRIDSKATPNKSLQPMPR